MNKLLGLGVGFALIGAGYFGSELTHSHNEQVAVNEASIEEFRGRVVSDCTSLVLDSFMKEHPELRNIAALNDPSTQEDEAHKAFAAIESLDPKVDQDIADCAVSDGAGVVEAEDVPGINLKDTILGMQEDSTQSATQSKDSLEKGDK